MPRRRRRLTTRVAKREIVLGTSGPRAAQAARRILEEGGTAADAAVAAVLSQITLAAGAWVSFAGMMSVMYYDARTRRVHALNAGFNTPRNETDPLTIPPAGRASGRSALVPGFMAGAQALHERFGVMSFGRVLKPAIATAEEGFRLDRELARLLHLRRQVIARSTAKAVLYNGDRPYRQGERFRQPALAMTLRQLSRHGSDYMYSGPWARRFIRAVRGAGGRLTLTDLSRYRPLWTEPVVCSFGPYRVHGPGLPGYGGVHTAEALGLIQNARLNPQTTLTLSHRQLYWLMQITHAPYVSWLSSGTKRLRSATLRRLWKQMVRRRGLTTVRVAEPANSASHSDAVVVADRWGNVAAICHSINTVAWGTTGLFVGGVSIPDSACYHQWLMHRVGPGRRLPDPMNPCLVFRGDRLHLAWSGIGTSLHESAVQCLLNTLNGGLSLDAAATAPRFLAPRWMRSRRQRQSSRTPKKGHVQLVASQLVERGEFSSRILASVRKLGQRVTHVPPGVLGADWAAIQFRAAAASLTGVVTGSMTGGTQATAGH